jgi:hypothetical protein
MPAQSPSGPPLGIVDHSRFVESLSTATFQGHRAAPGGRVADEDEFERMRAYALALHRDMPVAHSFVESTGQVFDCVPVGQQPSLRGRAGPIPQPPDLGRLVLGADAGPPSPPPEGPRALDRHGNVAVCPPGHVPVRRITLDEIARFRTLDAFRSKSPRHSMASDPSVPVADLGKNHRYAYTHQTVANFGGHDFLSVWSPPVGDKQIFSLAQHWYTGGTGAGHQTLEVGWQVYPQKYGHAQPVLFIFFTNDNYVNSKVYNLEGPGFVQTVPAWKIGGALSPVSSGTAQFELEIAVYLHDGNWWLYLGGTSAANAVGYYPTSIYNGGAMATSADEITYGGETVCEAGGTWPAMGSGEPAANGWQHAAYQRDIFMFPTDGGARYATLQGETPSPGCYTQVVGTARPPWNTYFFFGGAGGGDC